MCKSYIILRINVMLHFLQSFILYSFCAISMLIGIFEIIYIHVLESINHKLSQDFVNFCLNHALHGSINNSMLSAVVKFTGI